jgi:hypothetical protein
MVSSDPAADLRAGVAILDAVLQPHGFIFKNGEEGKGSGGTFASGQ